MCVSIYEDYSSNLTVRGPHSLGPSPCVPRFAKYWSFIYSFHVSLQKSRTYKLASYKWNSSKKERSYKWNGTNPSLPFVPFVLLHTRLTKICHKKISSYAPPPPPPIPMLGKCTNFTCPRWKTIHQLPAKHLELRLCAVLKERFCGDYISLTPLCHLSPPSFLFFEKQRKFVDYDL